MTASEVSETAASTSKDLTSLIIEAHGGAERWKSVASIQLKFNFSGAALRRKGFLHRFQPTCTVDAKNTKVVYQGLGYGDPDDRWIYTPHRVWIERQDGTVIAERENPYESFLDHTLTTKWDDLDLACFAGYAIHNYLTFPFHLSWPGFESREVEPHEENGEIWRVLEVTFPDYYPAHSKTQLFYFDKDFMLRREDYAPRAFKATASHYCYDFQDISGLKIPTLRRVVLRKPDTPPADGVFPLRGQSQLAGPSSFLLDYVEVHVRDEGE